MSATAQQRMRIANEKAMKNINNRGNVPKSTKESPEKYPVRSFEVDGFTILSITLLQCFLERYPNSNKTMAKIGCIENRRQLQVIKIIY